MFKIGLIGKGINHSKLFEFYQGLIPYSVDYILIDIERESELPSLMKLKQSYRGINITTPYKKSYFGQLEVDATTRQLGVLNCISLQGSGSIRGTNADYFAVRDIFDALNRQRKFEHIFILGNGVMSGITQFLFSQQNISYQVLARKKGDDIVKMDFSSYRNSLIINTCSRSFEFSGQIDNNSLFWDYNYAFRPHQAHFERNNQSSLYQDGLELLHLQGRYSVFFWGI